MNAIEIRGLVKSFKGINALDGFNMTVPVGSIYGFIGENGSGKSTTEKLICGLLVPTSGEIKLFGKDYTDAGVRARVGALIENPGCRSGVRLSCGAEPRGSGDFRPHRRPIGSRQVYKTASDKAVRAI